LAHGSARILATVAAAAVVCGLARLVAQQPVDTLLERCCHRHTAGRLTALWRATASAGKRSPDKRTIRAR